MSICRKSEKSLLDHDEWSLIETTHLPALAELSDADLAAARKRLRDMRDKQRDLGHQTRRAARGKADARGGNFPGTYARPKQKKQVFAHALRRLNDESGRREARASRDAIVASQKKALAKKRAAPSRRPSNTATAAAGPASITSAKRSTRTAPAKVGSVSQQGKRAQAKKDG